MFQSAGAIICKTAVCFLNNWVEKEGLDAKQVIFYHDEVEYEVHPDHAARVAELAVKSFQKAGEYHKFNLPLTGEAKIGRTWGDVH
jgi:DNA polymerase I-like protein with 3'-5' exonuclease and polymerase domains